MENASKALIIAAAVLIAILLIALGMGIFNSTAQPTDSLETSMTTTEISTFNGKFTQYQGDNKSLAVVRALADKVIAHNAVDEVNKVKIKIGSNAATDDANAIMSNVAGLSGTSFKITVTVNGNGLVNSITVI